MKKHKEKLGRKLLSFVLTVAMIIGMMPQLSLTAKAAYSGGSGTADDPYLISTTADWNALADAVNDGAAGNHFEGKYFKMTADITMTSTDDEYYLLGKRNNNANNDSLFSGIFDGDGHTLTVNITSGKDMAAPFSYVNGATIQNLNVAGTVTTTSNHGSGLVGAVKNNAGSAYAGSLTVNNVKTSVTVTGGGSYQGGFVGHNHGSTTSFTKCIFDGSMSGDRAGGLIGWDGGKCTVNDCLFSGEVTSVNNFHAVGYSGGSTYLTDYYSTVGNRGASGRSIYSGTINVISPVAQVGNTKYCLFEGTKTASALPAWADGATLTLLADVTTAGTISVSGTKTLDLNGFGIKASASGYSVITASGGANLTVNDSNPDAVHKYSIASPQSNGAGLATVDDENGAQTFTGGYLTGSRSSANGGVNVVANGQLTLNGGTIIGNQGTGEPGGVQVAQGAKMTMNGGAVVGNTSPNGGAGINARGIVIVTGGTIAYNYAYSGGCGGGIRTHSPGGNTSYAEVSGGSITNNYATGRAGGIGEGKVVLHGAPVIQENYSNAGKDNVYVIASGTYYVYITEALTNTTSIGVKRDGNTGVFTDGDVTWNDFGKFKSDNESYAVGKNASGQLFLGTPVTLTYDGNGATGGNVPADGNSPYASGSTVTVLGNTGSLANDGFAFDGWNTAADGSGTPYAADATFTISADTTLYAQWKFSHEHDGITFDAWTSNNSLPTTAGNYCLTQDVTISGSWNVPEGTTNLCLNGHGIKKTGSGRVISIASGRVLNLYDDSTTTHKYSIASPIGNGAGLATVDDVNGTQTFTGGYITGGYITGGSDLDGAGVKVEGTFNLVGGTIIGNSGTATGGGVYVGNGGMFQMTGGALIGNSTQYGGGVGSGAPGSAGFTNLSLTGGTIAYNKSTGTGGGVHMNANTGSTARGIKITIAGDIVIENNHTNGTWTSNANAGGGVIIDGLGTIFNLSGSPVIQGNTAGEDTASHPVVDNNLYFTNRGTPKVIVGNFTPGTPVGVTMMNKTGVFTSSDDTSNNNITLFKSDLDGYAVDKDADGQLYLGTPVTLTYDGNGATGGSVPVDGNSPYASGSTVTVLGNTGSLANDGFAFDGWNTAADGSGTPYAADATFTISADTTLYAQWKSSHIHDGITFDAWTSNNSLPTTAGNYCLTQDVTISGSWNVPEGTTKLCLNGHKITIGNHIYIPAGYALEIYDCGDGMIDAQYRVGSMFWINGGSLTLNGGTMNGNVSTAGIVDIAADATFIMNGGKITGKSVGRYDASVIRFTGANGMFTMNGGEISGTTTVAGVTYFASTDVTINVSGTAIISNNTINGGGIKNLYLPTDVKINVTGALDASASIGITMQTPGVFTSGASGMATTGNFTSDDSNYLVREEGGELKLGVAHTHDWSYQADGATITASCDGDGTCDVSDGLTMTISAPANLTYDGYAKAASLNTDYNKTAFPDTYAIKYYQGTTEVVAEDVKNAGDYTAKVTVGTGTGAATASVDFTIGKANASIKTIPTAKTGLVYDGTNQTLLNADGVATGGTLQYAIGGNATTAPTSGYGAAISTGKNAGTYYIWCKAIGDANHDDSVAVCVTLTVAKKALTITADSDERAFTGEPLTKNGYSSEGLVAGDVISSVTVTGSQTTAGSSENVPSSAVIKNGDADMTANYDITYVKGTLRIVQAPVNTVTVSLAGWTYGESAKTPTSTATFGAGTVVYAYSDAADGTFTATVPVNAGTWYVKASVAETADYNGGSAVTSFVIAQKSLTITADSASKVYDTTALTQNGYTGNGLVAGDVIDSVTVTGMQTTVGSSANMPSAAVIKNGDADVTANYDVAYVNGTLTVTKALTNAVTVDLTGWTYGDSANAPTSTADFGEDTVVFTYSDAADGTFTATAPTYAGTWYVKAFVADTANYAQGEAVNSFVIAKKTLTITADSDSKEYDATALTKDSYTSTALAAGDAIDSVTVAGTQTNVGSSANVPSSAVIKNGSTDVTANYDITYANGTLTVTKALSNEMFVDIVGWTYGDSANAPTSRVKLGGDTVVYSYSDAADGTFTATVPTNAGTWYMKAAVAGTENYVEIDAVKSFVIARKPLTITAGSSTKVYDGTAITNGSYGNTALVAGDEITSLTIIGSQLNAGSSTNVPSSAVIKKGSIDVTDNYGITYANGTLTVTKAMTNVVTVDVAGWTYGDGAKAPSSTATFGADTVVYTYSDKADGTYAATVPVNAGQWFVKATVPETENYVEGSAVKSFVIAKKAATITAVDKSKTYGDADPAFTANIAGTVGSDSLNYALSRATGENVGTYAISVTANEADNPNYDVTVTGATLTIGVREIVISNIVAEDKDYDGNNAATLDFSYVIFGNSVPSDAGKLTVTATGTFDDEKVGKGKTVTITGLTLGGEAASNYVLAAAGQQATAIADVSEMKDETNVPSNFVAKVKDFTGQDRQPAVTGLDLALATSLCTPAELAAYGMGDKLGLSLEISKAGSLMTDDAVTMVTNALKNDKGVKLDGAAYYDISLYKKNGAGPAVKVTDLNGSFITVTMDVPEDMHNHKWENKRTYYIVRIHAGAAQVIAETTDLSVTFSSDKFSVYAICYADSRVVSYESQSSSASAGTAVVAPKTYGVSASEKLLVLFGTAAAVVGIVTGVYAFRRRKEEEE